MASGIRDIHGLVFRSSDKAKIILLSCQPDFGLHQYFLITTQSFNPKSSLFGKIRLRDYAFIFKSKVKAKQNLSSQLGSRFTIVYDLHGSWLRSMFSFQRRSNLTLRNNCLVELKSMCLKR